MRSQNNHHQSRLRQTRYLLVMNRSSAPQNRQIKYNEGQKLSRKFSGYSCSWLKYYITKILFKNVKDKLK
jgi:hypothetical protein